MTFNSTFWEAVIVTLVIPAIFIIAGVIVYRRYEKRGRPSQNQGFPLLTIFDNSRTDAECPHCGEVTSIRIRGFKGQTAWCIHCGKPLGQY
jgi:hypothetical protein